MTSLAGRIGFFCAVVHLVLFLFMASHVSHNPDPQVSFLWVWFAIVDFPVSLLYMLIPADYVHWVRSLSNPLIARLCYAPHIIHGLFGTLWWGVLPRAVMPRRLGGIWALGRSQSPTR